MQRRRLRHARSSATACNTANTLRLWRAEAAESFDFAAFNRGDYYGAVEREDRVGEPSPRCSIRTTSREAGKELRLEQQYFFVSCSLQDMLRIYDLQRRAGLERFHEKFAVQLNDTHPAIAVAELMRLLVDEHAMSTGTRPGTITRADLRLHQPHAAARGAGALAAARCSGALLPRHLEIIYEINARFLDEVRARFPGDDDRVARMSLIDEDGERYVRMAHLACVGSHADQRRRRAALASC